MRSWRESGLESCPDSGSRGRGLTLRVLGGPGRRCKGFWDLRGVWGFRV